MRLIKIILILSGLSFSQGFLHTAGKEIVEGNGEPILLRGFGLGGWLVPEGYMLINRAWIEGFESPTQIENHVVDLIGEEKSNEFWDEYRKNFVSRADIDQIAEWGFNHIRLPFHYKQFHTEDGSTPIGYEIVDTLLSWCEPYNMYVILDMHCAPGAQNGGPISDSDGIARLWLEEDKKELTVQIWREIADYYSDNTLIGGYDLINEPVLPGGVSLTEFKQLYIDITQAIREVDQNHIVFVEGNWYGTDFSGLTPPWDNNMSYSFHKYWGETDISTIQSYLSMRNTYNVPLWMGESGENSNSWYYETLIKLLEENNIGWNFWCHKKADKITSPYSAIISPEYNNLLNYFEGNTVPPTSQEAEYALSTLTENLKIENCHVNEGVISCLTDPEYGSVSKPYRAHSIPGTIAAVHYDVGNWGISYTDDNWYNNGDGGYNDGWSYRNDGVDVESNTNPNGYPYNIGWTETGEWLGYTVENVTPGNYNINVSVASNGDGGMFFIQINGVNISVLNVPTSTGGWYNWSDLTIPNVEISNENQFIRLQIVQGGFNIESISFESVLSTPKEDAVLNKFKLETAYPNPFNNNIKIPYKTSGDNIISAKIFNLMGQSVIDLFEGNIKKGTHYLTWNGLNNLGQEVPSGTYIFVIENEQSFYTQKLLLLK
ncbi:cellulase family glycosylhydrolase [Candidatus Marinimicrobia bacterium]|nr:cellulase family glycosylhydrolase [Candidatus Neomarinimicrobiota bacterium]|tara:strand:+ start:1057 stop:3033 length:1977 start_codon:yes stop_codon:yes gene_type:complete